MAYGPYSYGPYRYGPYTAIARIVIALCSYGPYRYGPYSYGPYIHGPYSYGPYTVMARIVIALCSYGVCVRIRSCMQSGRRLVGEGAGAQRGGQRSGHGGGPSGVTHRGRSLRVLSSLGDANTPLHRDRPRVRAGKCEKPVSFALSDAGPVRVVRRGHPCAQWVPCARFMHTCYLATLLPCMPAVRCALRTRTVRCVLCLRATHPRTCAAVAAVVHFCAVSQCARGTTWLHSGARCRLPSSQVHAQRYCLQSLASLMNLQGLCSGHHSTCAALTSHGISLFDGLKTVHRPGLWGSVAPL